jgi:hypothetical protein
MSNVIDMANWQEKREDESLDAWLEHCEEFELDLTVKMHQSMEAHLRSVAEIYSVSPAMVAELCMGGLMAILGNAIEEHDSDAAKDVLNFCAEISEEFLESSGCRMGRDQDERLAWREDTYKHRWREGEEPPANEGGDQ